MSDSIVRNRSCRMQSHIDRDYTRRRSIKAQFLEPQHATRATRLPDVPSNRVCGTRCAAHTMSSLEGEPEYQVLHRQTLT